MPDIAIHALLQTERLVECLEAEYWGGRAELETFRDVYAAACSQSHVPPLPLDADALGHLRLGMEDLVRQWKTGSYRFRF